MTFGDVQGATGHCNKIKVLVFDAALKLYSLEFLTINGAMESGSRTIEGANVAHYRLLATLFLSEVCY